MTSPAATRADYERDLVRDHYTKVCHCQWSDDEFTRTMTSQDCSIHGTIPDPLDALVGRLIELEQRLVAACEPCAECGHVDWRELDDMVKR